MVGRDDKGRWIKGHAKTGGRSTRVEEDKFYKVWNKKFPTKRIGVILEKLGVMAERGDLGAIKLILEYLYGKPIDRQEITGADGKPMEINVIEIVKDHGK
jgi:hypothetical protein